MTDKPKFTIGDRVKCFHGAIMYSAKVVKYELKDKAHKYFVHYEGWNKNWDEWVSEGVIELHTDEPKTKKSKNTTESHDAAKEVVSSVGRKKKKEIESDNSRPSTPAGGDVKEATETPSGRKRTAGKAFSSDKKSGRRDSRASKREKLDSTPTSAPPTSATPTSSSSGGAGATAGIVAATPTVAEAAPTGDESSVSGQTPLSSASSSSSSSTAPLARTAKSAKIAKNAKNKSAAKPAKIVRRLSTTVSKEEIDADNMFKNKICIKFKLNEKLRNCIINDFDFVLSQKKLLRLPAKKTIEDIMTDYINTRKSSTERDRISTFCDGIKEYFNTSLGKILLYKFERHQYANAIKEHADLLTLKQEQLTPINDLDNKLKEKQLVRIYGAIHLIRLFTRIGDMLTFSEICKSTLKYIIKFVEDFSVYISEFPEYYDEDNYYLASPEYLRSSLDIVS